MQQSRMGCKRPLACHAIQLPFRLSQRQPEKAAESGSAKMQPKPVYRAERALTDAGFRPQQAKGLVSVVGDVIEPLAQQSSVLEVKELITEMRQKLNGLDNKLTILLFYVAVEIAVKPDSVLRGILLRVIDVSKPVAGT